MSTLIFTWQGVGLGEESNARYCGGWLFLRGFSDCSQAVLWVEVLFPAPLERAGTMASQPGPYFFEEIGERTPRGRRFLPLGTPFSGGRNGGRRFRQVGAWPAASKTNASWPAHQLGRAGEVIHRREEKTGTRMVTFCLLPKGTCPCPQPAQPVGGPLPAFQREGRRPGTK